MCDPNDATFKRIKHYQSSLDRYLRKNEKEKLLECMSKLKTIPVNISLLSETGIGKTVNSLRRFDGRVGKAADLLVDLWKEVVANDTQKGEYIEEALNTKKDKNGSSQNSDKQLGSKSQIIETDKNCHREKMFSQNSSNGNHKTNHLKPFKDKSNRESSNSKRKLLVEDNSFLNGLDYLPQQKKSKKFDSKRSDDSENQDSEDFVDEETPYENSSELASNKTISSELKGSNKRSDKEYEDKVKSNTRTDNSCSQNSRNGDDPKKSDKRSKDKDCYKEKNYFEDSSNSKHKDKYSNKKETDKKSDKFNDKSNSKELSKTITEESTSKHIYSDNTKESTQKNPTKHPDESPLYSKHSDSSKNSVKKSDADVLKKSKHSSNSKSTHNSNSKSSRSNSSKNKESSGSSSKESTSSKIKKSSSSKNIVEDGGIDSTCGASFEEALGMLGGKKSQDASKSSSSNKKKSSDIKKSTKFEENLIDSTEIARTSKSSATPDIPVALIRPMKLEPLDINMQSLLPTISTNYKPLGNNLTDIQNNRQKFLNDDEALSLLMYSKNQRTKVYSGNKYLFGEVPSLFQLCTRVLQDNIDALEYTGGVPYSILKPVLDKATPDQLFMLEHHNPYIMDDSDELWNLHCNREFKAKRREEMETSREMYIRCFEEREAKLKALTANIKLSQAESVPVRQTKLAYVDSFVKPPRNVARKQAKHGTAQIVPHVTPTARLQQLAKSGSPVKVPAPTPGRSPASPSTSSNSNSSLKIKKAPLMAKTLQLMKGRFRR